MRQIITMPKKPLKNFLLVFATVLSSSHPKSSETSGTRIIGGKQITLAYQGSITTSEGNGLIGVVVYIDTTIGVRYEMTNGISHIAIFYKFSVPYQTVLYNFNTHKSEVVKANGSKDSGQELDLIGTENVSGYSCTHLQHGGGTNEVWDYWMSPNIPGFSKLVNALKRINPGMPALAFNGTIFNSGGLVRWKIYSVDKQSGETINLELHLTSANTKVHLPATTWEVPAK